MEINYLSSDHIDHISNYKITSMRELLNNNTQMWEFQRTLNMDRVIDLTNSFKNNYKQFGSFCIRQAIIICKYNGNDYIIDGQHRYVALYNLIKDNFINDVNVLVVYIECKEQKDIRFEFKNINDIIVVPKCYINPSELIDQAINILMRKYSNLKKSIKRINRPNVDIDKVKSTLIEADIIHKLNVVSCEHLVNIIDKLNVFYSEKDITYFANMFKLSVTDKTLNNIFGRIREKGSHHLGLFKPELSILWIQDLTSLS